MNDEKLIDYMRISQQIDKVKIKGMGEKTAEKIKELGIETVRDLLYYFPRTYEDRTNVKEIKDLRPEEYAVVTGTIRKAEIVKARNRRTIFKILISDDTGYIEAVWFQMPYLKSTLTVGEKVVLTGKIKSEFGLKMQNPEHKIIRENSSEDKNSGRVLPVYGLVAGLTQNVMRKVVYGCLEDFSRYCYEVIPNEIMEKYKLQNRKIAINELHFPKDDKSLEEAKRRMAVEELLVLEMGILAKRFETDNKNSEKYVLDDNKELVKKFLNNIGFQLTRAQKKVITEIYKDLTAGKIVNRLIQGDVGSGKTIVAVVMLLYMIENGYQGAFMAPTEILAEQHYLGVVDRLSEIGIKVEIITSALKGKKKEEILNRIEQGDVDLVIGTHALIEENVKFSKLGLIVIDEQHRFGVMQRKRLRDKGILANLLVMSATPIPRSLALSIYGDLDVSVIDELPPGRKPIKTKWIKDNVGLAKVYDFIDKKIAEGRQCYIVCPLIEESEKLTLRSVEELYDELKEDVFTDRKIAVMHGKMKNEEREVIMRKFKNNEIEILVATTVIEVGVNVPNSSIMLILDAQRFGLAQLHQLRGRVGRGEWESFCFMMANTDNEISKSRLKIMEKTTDGFEIAEEDLRLRKPGEIFGTRQSGISDLQFSEVINDIKTIKLARDETMEYLKKTKGIIENRFMEKEIEMKFTEEFLRG